MSSIFTPGKGRGSGAQKARSRKMKSARRARKHARLSSRGSNTHGGHQIAFAGFEIGCLNGLPTRQAKASKRGLWVTAPRGHKKAGWAHEKQAGPTSFDSK